MGRILLVEDDGALASDLSENLIIPSQQNMNTNPRGMTTISNGYAALPMRNCLNQDLED